MKTYTAITQGIHQTDDIQSLTCAPTDFLSILNDYLLDVPASLTVTVIDDNSCTSYHTGLLPVTGNGWTVDKDGRLIAA